RGGAGVDRRSARRLPGLAHGLGAAIPGRARGAARPDAGVETDRGAVQSRAPRRVPDADPRRAREVRGQRVFRDLAPAAASLEAMPRETIACAAIGFVPAAIVLGVARGRGA